jgi:hypothetical protein
MSHKSFRSLLAITLVLACLLAAGLACSLGGGASAPNPAENPSSAPAPGAVVTSAGAVGTQSTGGEGGPQSDATAVPIVLPPAPPEARRLVLEWPRAIRAGESDWIILSLLVDKEGNLTPTAQVVGNQVRGEPVQIPNLYDTHHVFVEARLDLAGVTALPAGEVSESLLPGEPVTFRWSVRPESVGNYRGTLWLHLVFVPLDGSAENRRVLSAQPIEINSVNLLGLGGMPARVLSGVGVVVGSLLGLDNVLKWAAGLLKRLLGGKGKS